MNIIPVPREIMNDLQYNLIDVKLLQSHVLDKTDFILLNSYHSNQEKVEILMELMRKKSKKDHNNFLKIIEEDYNWLRDKCEIFLQKVRLDTLVVDHKAQCAPFPAVLEEKVLEKSSTEENDRSSPKVTRNPSSPDSIAIVPCTEKSKTKALSPLKKIKEEIMQIKSEEKLNQTITREMMTVVRRNYRVVRNWSTLAHNLGMTSVVHTLRMRMIINGEDIDACVLHLLEEWKGAQPKDASLGKLISVLRGEDFNDVADELEDKFAV